ncbi:uncharacterized protein BcabD6B2_03370 [Babesia caballi]|uniref:Uncharacterized protein n=1 Tax=Babesia caballi TaxID=5871 RepID=A0AAV4LMD4_BABCB|nr:hypothetical protein BcabD6B2_03370 [Babesia caballi]
MLVHGHKRPEVVHQLLRCGPVHKLQPPPFRPIPVAEGFHLVPKLDGQLSEERRVPQYLADELLAALGYWHRQNFQHAGLTKPRRRSYWRNAAHVLERRAQIICVHVQRGPPQAVVSVEELHHLAVARPHRVVIAHRKHLQRLHQPPLHVPRFAGLHRRVDESLPAGHGVEKELLRLKPGEEGVRHEAAALRVHAPNVEVRQRAPDEPVLYPLPRDVLLPHQRHHLGDVDQRPLGARVEHDEGLIVRPQVRVARLPRLVSQLVQHPLHLQLQRLLPRATRQRLQRVEAPDRLRHLRVPVLQQLVLLKQQVLPRPHVVQADGHPEPGQPAAGQLGNPEHTVGCNVPVVPRQQLRLFPQRARHELRVVENHVAVLGAHARVHPPRRLLELPLLALEIHHHLAPLVRPQQRVEDLLPRPQRDGVYQRRRRQVHLRLAVREVAARLAELLPREEPVLRREQVARAQKVLHRRDQRLPVPRRRQVVEHVHEVERLRLRLVGLRQVQVHLVAVKVRVVRLAYALVEPEGRPRHDPHPVGHDAHPVQRRLPVEEDHVPVPQVPQHHVADGQVVAHVLGVGVLQAALPAVLLLDVRGPRPHGDPVQHRLLHDCDVGRRHLLGERQLHGDPLRHHHLVHADVGVRRDDGPGGEVHALPAEVPAEAPLLALEPLADAPARLGDVARDEELRHGRRVRVDEPRALQLEALPAEDELADLAAVADLVLPPVVQLHNVRENARQVVLRGPLPLDGDARANAALQHYRGSTRRTYRRHRQVGDEQLLRRYHVQYLRVDGVYGLEELLHHQRVQVLLHRLHLPAVLELDHVPQLHELVHHRLHDPPDHPLLGVAARALGDFAALLHDLFEEQRLEQRVVDPPPVRLQELLHQVVRQQQVRALLADAVEYLDGVLEEPDVEHWQLQPDVPPVADALLEVLSARQAQALPPLLHLRVQLQRPLRPGRQAPEVVLQHLVYLDGLQLLRGDFNEAVELRPVFPQLRRGHQLAGARLHEVLLLPNHLIQDLGVELLVARVPRQAKGVVVVRPGPHPRPVDVQLPRGVRADGDEAVVVGPPAVGGEHPAEGGVVPAVQAHQPRGQVPGLGQVVRPAPVAEDRVAPVEDVLRQVPDGHRRRVRGLGNVQRLRILRQDQGVVDPLHLHHRVVPLQVLVHLGGQVARDGGHPHEVDIRRRPRDGHALLPHVVELYLSRLDADDQHVGVHLVDVHREQRAGVDLQRRLALRRGHRPHPQKACVVRGVQHRLVDELVARQAEVVLCDAERGRHVGGPAALGELHLEDRLPHPPVVDVADAPEANFAAAHCGEVHWHHHPEVLDRRVDEREAGLLGDLAQRHALVGLRRQVHADAFYRLDRQLELRRHLLDRVERPQVLASEEAPGAVLRRDQGGQLLRHLPPHMYIQSRCEFGVFDSGCQVPAPLNIALVYHLPPVHHLQRHLQHPRHVKDMHCPVHFLHRREVVSAAVDDGRGHFQPHHVRLEGDFWQPEARAHLRFPVPARLARRVDAKLFGRVRVHVETDPLREALEVLLLGPSVYQGPTAEYPVVSVLPSIDEANSQRVLRILLAYFFPHDHEHQLVVSRDVHELVDESAEQDCGADVDHRQVAEVEDQVVEQPACHVLRLCRPPFFVQSRVVEFVQ